MQRSVQHQPHCLLKGYHVRQHASLSHCPQCSDELNPELCVIWGTRGWDTWQGEAVFPTGEGGVNDQLSGVPAEASVICSTWYCPTFRSLLYRAEFSSYSEHIVSAWFLRATKLELQAVQSTLRHLGLFTSDFGENILVKGKHETSDQYFHRLEVCLFGAVSCLPSSDDQTKTETISNIITSDYKWVGTNIIFYCVMTRVKDNKFVACALDSVLGPALEKARAEGLDITTVILKVCQKLFSISLTISLLEWPSFFPILEQRHGAW